MRFSFRLAVFVLVALGLIAGAAGAQATADASEKMERLFTSPNQATNSDLAFWGDHAFVGYYTGGAGFPPGTGPRGGVRIFDISDPAAPRLVRNFACDGAQNDPIVWDRNGNGVADLMLLAVDTTMAAPQCGAARVAGGTPTGWEGVRVFTMSDDPANPFTNITQVKSVYTDCGAHTITLWPEEPGRLLVYVSSYPLGAGPTCGDTEYLNTANPYDEDPGSPANPLHGVIQIVEVPLANPAAAQELDVQPAISYPGDPDGRMEWGEKGLPSPPFEPAAVACHDIVVHVEERMAGGAAPSRLRCGRSTRTGSPTRRTRSRSSTTRSARAVPGTSPGRSTSSTPRCSTTTGPCVNTVDESFGSGCPTMTTYQPRPWNPAGGTHKTGRMFFSDTETGEFFSEFHVGDLRPSSAPGEYCSAHMGMQVMGIQRDLLVNAWYTGGADVIDFTQPTRPKEIAYYDPVWNSGTWSAYPYTGPMFRTGPGIPVYASDGVTNNGLAQGMVVYRTIVEKPGVPTRVDHLNPQTMD